MSARAVVLPEWGRITSDICKRRPSYRRVSIGKLIYHSLEFSRRFGGSPVKSILKWDGETLTIETQGTFGDNAFTMKDKWSLSADGKVLTILRHFSSGMGETDQKLIFDKQ